MFSIGVTNAAAYNDPIRTVTRHVDSNRNLSGKSLERVQEIEQHRWGGPDTSSLFQCESTMGLGVGIDDGPYQGVAQMGSHEWAVSWADVVRDQKRRIYYVTYEQHGDVKVIHSGRLRKHATRQDDWAMVRVVQRAKAGQGPDWSWSCW